MYRHILIPTDGSPCSDQAVSHGLALAKHFNASVTFLHVIDASPPAIMIEAYDYAACNAQLREDLRHVGQEILDSCVQRAQGTGVAVQECLLESAHPSQSILELSEEHDLVIMGSHGRSGLSRFFLGSVTEAVMRRSHKPVLVVRCQEKAESKQRAAAR